jgi:hypothetical protein
VSKHTRKGKGKARAALGGLNANGLTPNKPSGAAQKKIPAKKEAKAKEAASLSESPVRFSESLTSRTSSAGVSPICVSWYRDSARECIFPEWIELAIAMGYDRDTTNAAVRELLTKPARFHTFDAFVDTLETMEGPKEANAKEGGRPSTDLRAKMKAPPQPEPSSWRLGSES